MKLPDWRTLGLDESILAEIPPKEDRAVLWLPRGRAGGDLCWERISPAAGAEIVEDQGLRATPATSIPARQRGRGFLGGLLPRLGRRTAGRAWTLPNGESAEQAGERRTDLLLAWALDGSDPGEESRIKALWPTSRGVERIGKNLLLISGAASRRVAEQAAPELPQGSPREQAQKLLASARLVGDRRGEASALTDLGIILLREGDPGGAVPLLEGALAMVRQVGDQAREGDVIGNLGDALLGIGQPERGLELIEQGLASARVSGDRFAEKSALERLGFAHLARRDPVRAIGAFEGALGLAREVGDQQHAADLLWTLAIGHAQLDRRDRAIARAEEAVALLRTSGNPKAPWFEEHLRQYRAADEPAWPGAAGPGRPSDMRFGGSVVVSTMAGQPGPQSMSGQATSGPGLLSMAFSAAEAMAKFLGSGFKTTTQETQQERLRTCASCDHHTGVRCRLCGCITSIKARMPHEKCPVGKWPS